MSTTLKERHSPELRSGRRTRAAPERTTRRARVAYLDNLKVLLVAVIIAAHGIAAYSDLESAWPYQDVQEVQLGAVSNGVLSLGAGTEPDVVCSEVALELQVIVDDLFEDVLLH